MEYQYYVDQIQNQTNGSTNQLETGSIEAATVAETAPETKAEASPTEIINQSEAKESGDSPALESGIPASLDASKEIGLDDSAKSLIATPPWTDPVPVERALPLADAFTRRQHYVESLLTCSAAGRQCVDDGDPLNYLRFRAKNESIMCELTNARGRLSGRTGPLSMPLSRKDAPAHRMRMLLLFMFAYAFLATALYSFLSHRP